VFALNPLARDVGTYQITVKLIDSNPEPKATKYNFTVTVEPSRNETSQHSSSNDNRLAARIKSISYTGRLVI